MKESNQLYWNKKPVKVIKHYLFDKSKICVIETGEEFIVNDCLLKNKMEYTISISLLEGKNKYA